MARTDRAPACGCERCAGRRGGAEAVAESVPPESKHAPSGLLRRSRYSVIPIGVEAVRRAARDYAEYVGNHEPGIYLYLVTQPAGSATEFVHLAAYSDEGVLASAQGSAAYRRFVEVLRPLLAGAVEVEATAGEALAESGSRLISRQDTSVMVKLTVKRRSDLPRFERLVVAFTHRTENGLLSSDAFRQPDDERVFFIYERWSSQAAVDAAQGGKLQLELLALAKLEAEQEFSLT